MDYREGKALDVLEFYDSDLQQHDVHDLLRYDQGKHYQVAGQSAKCRESDLTAKWLPFAWDWVAKAAPVGLATPGTDAYQLWRYKAAGVTVSVGVALEDADRLVLFSRATADEEYVFYVEPANATAEMEAARPHSSWFDVPIACRTQLAGDVSSPLVAQTR